VSEQYVVFTLFMPV